MTRTLDYAQFAKQIGRRAAEERIPLSATIEVTHRCPLECSHCYNNLPVADRQAQARELTTEEHFRLIDELARAGTLWLLYTGGEIFARPDFLDIYTYARKRGLLITLFTNGTMITPAIADHLALYRPFAIEITLYGATRESYEGLTQVPGSFDRCMRGIELLKARDLPLKLKTVAVGTNQHEIGAMQTLAEQALGLPFKFDGVINPRIDRSLGPLAVRLLPEEVVALDLKDPTRVAAWNDFGRQTLEAVPLVDDRGHVYRCAGGLRSFSISPDGMLSICILSQNHRYDLRRGSFHEGWSQFLDEVRHKKASRRTKCTECRIKPICGMCPASAELENGDPEEPVDFLCQVAHLRAEVLGWTVPAHGECEYCTSGARHDEIVQAAARITSGATSNARRLPLAPVARRAECASCTSCGG